MPTKMKTNVLVLFLLIVTCFLACNADQSKIQTPVSGATTIVVDESFAPIVQEQYDVFRNDYQSADIKLIFQPENKLLYTFLSNKVNVAIMSRTLLPNEAKVFESKNIKIRINRFAIDGIALIANSNYPDSVVTVAEVINVLKGANKKINLVFDNANSSTVRYLKELAKISQLPATGVYAQNSNKEVVEYVHNNKGAIGVIGVNWIKDPAEDIEKLISGIKVLKVKNLPGLPGGDDYYLPSQNNLAMKIYPLRRNLYIINCEGAAALGTGFASFLASERGQRIVLKSGLMPDSLPSREIFVK